MPGPTEGDVDNGSALDSTSMSALSETYGKNFIVRPPVPATANKAGANYKSEVAHLTYSPRKAFDEWLGVLDGIVEFGGDALFLEEPEDEVFLDHQFLQVDQKGDIFAQSSGQRLGNMEDIQTGRVFAANGPWVSVDKRRLRGGAAQHAPSPTK